ncbi:MAG: hypothetical protein KIT69_20270, partial [Propionibacteriaceae bacterium]|nr:hypothetical protein [Propionibacteriaceae bacterium]
WQDDQLVYETGDLVGVSGSNTGQVRFALDLVPMTAGAHLAMARAYDTEGHMAQTKALAIPAMDAPEDLGEFQARDADGEGLWPGFRLSTAPGETLASIGDRLGIDPASLIAADGTTMTQVPLPLGTLVTGVVPPVERLKFPPTLSDDALSYLNAVVDDCDVVVTSELAADLRIYGGPGLVALGDLPAGGELRLTTLPVGPTMLVGYPPAAAESGVKPSFPITVTIPDSCARDGWTGDAYVTGGIMLTDFAIPRTYAYIAVDKGEWQRVPALEGSYLNASSTPVTDLRPYVNLGAYDQIDLEVWSGTRGEGPVATGHYCRAEASHRGPEGSSGSGGECTPKQPVVPGSPGASPQLLSLSIAAASIPGTGSKTSVSPFSETIWTSTPPAGIAFSATQTDPVDVRFTTNAAQTGAPGEVYYQFSYLPM